jgi:lysozyme family protein
MVEKDGEEKVFNELIDERKRWFKALNQPANEKGWLNRMETLRKEGTAWFSKSLDVSIEAVKKKPLLTISITVAVVVASYFVYKKFIKNK